MQLDTTSLTSVAPKRNLSSNLMDFLRSQHLGQAEYDEQRTKYLNSPGYKVIRFWNNDVMKNLDGVILAILHALEEEAGKE